MTIRTSYDLILVDWSTLDEEILHGHHGEYEFSGMDVLAENIVWNRDDQTGSIGSCSEDSSNVGSEYIPPPIAAGSEQIEGVLPTIDALHGLVTQDMEVTIQGECNGHSSRESLEYIKPHLDRIILRSGEDHGLDDVDCDSIQLNRCRRRTQQGGASQYLDGSESRNEAFVVGGEEEDSVRLGRRSWLPSVGQTVGRRVITSMGPSEEFDLEATGVREFIVQLQDFEDDCP
jgi:hypothetical protein